MDQFLHLAGRGGASSPSPVSYATAEKCFGREEEGSSYTLAKF